MKFKIKYAILTILLFGIEVLIARFHFNHIVRSYVGDVLVVILLYSFLKTFLVISSEKLAVGVLLFAFLVEFLQFFNLVEQLHIQSKLIKTVLGSVFDPLDFLAYLTGFLLIITIEKSLQKK